MARSFDERVIDAVRAGGPDALPSAIIDEMDGGEFRLFGGVSLGRVMHRLKVLAAQGVLRTGSVVDAKGRTRTTYSMGTGRLRRRGWLRMFAPSPQPAAT